MNREIRQRIEDGKSEELNPREMKCFIVDRFELSKWYRMCLPKKLVKLRFVKIYREIPQRIED